MAAWVICNELPATGLTQSMHDVTFSLKVADVMLNNDILNRGDEGARTSRFFIADVIQRLHKYAVKTVFEGCQEQFLSFPVAEKVEPVKTQFWRLAGITADEGTIKGTHAVYDDIFVDQLGYQNAASYEAADDFTERLLLIHGDQLTTPPRIRSVQHEQRHARLEYDRRQWLTGVRAWFQSQYNLLPTIVRTHWKPVGGKTGIHCISSDATRWNRSQNSRDIGVASKLNDFWKPDVSV